MTILVFGATGQVGGALVSALLRQGADVRAVSRSAEKIAALPADVQGHVGDLDDPESLRGAVDGAEAVFLMVANGPTETHQGLTTLSIVFDAKPKHIVYLSSDLSTRAPLVPHAGSKLGIEAALRASGISCTILRPTYFAQNDLLARPAILEGAYAVPIGGMPIARVHVRDIADAAAKSLLERLAVNRCVLLSSSDQPNGDETAALWSTALGRPVIFPDQSPQEWAESAKANLPAWMLFDLTLMHRHLREFGHPVNDEDLRQQETLLPNGPRSYRSFIEETANAWRTQGG